MMYDNPMSDRQRRLIMGLVVVSVLSVWMSLSQTVVFAAR